MDLLHGFGEWHSRVVVAFAIVMCSSSMISVSSSWPEKKVGT